MTDHERKVAARIKLLCNVMMDATSRDSKAQAKRETKAVSELLKLCGVKPTKEVVKAALPSGFGFFGWCDVVLQSPHTNTENGNGDP